MYNNTNDPLKIKNKIDEFSLTFSEKEFIQKFQYIVKEYLIWANNRGILIYHGVGYGKSITAAAISNYYRKYDPKRKIIMLLPKSIHKNMKNNISKFLRNDPYSSKSEKSKDIIEDIINTNYNFVSLNSSKMYDKVLEIGKNSLLDIDKELGEFTENVQGSLENSLLIIDEFHNLSNSITNGSKNAIKLYNKLMDTRDIKLIFLTGTPIINHPFELVPTFNLLKGNIKIGKTVRQLFPENKEEFESFFLRENHIFNKEKFQNRIFGMVSYYGDYYFDKKDNDAFAVELSIIVKIVPMSIKQYLKYREARDIELEEESNKINKKNKNDNFTMKAENSGISSYRIRSRQCSNYCIPDYALKYSNNHRSVEKFINDIKKEDLLNLDEYSPKFKAVINNINLYSRKLGFVYSEFVNGEGLVLFSKILELHGYEKYDGYKKNDIAKKFKFKDPKNKIEKESNKILTNSKINSYSNKKPKNFLKPKSEFESESEENLESSDGDDILNEEILINDDLYEEELDNNKLYDEKNEEDKEEIVKDGGNMNIKKFAFITGDIDPIMKHHTISVFNSKENIRGELISLLLISKAGAEGISLYNIRHIHIMEPFWNYARIEQIIARGVRYKGHDNLDKEERNVQPYIYLSTFPVDYKIENKKEDQTTDESIFFYAKKGKTLLKEFEIAIIQTSIDCSINNTYPNAVKQIECYLCAPTNEQLYDIDLYKDINEPNRCKPMKKNNVEAKEIVIKIDDVEQKYYYMDDNGTIKIFVFSKKYNGYIPMKKSNPLYSLLIKKILSLEDTMEGYNI